jgi:two-component system response regulator YesN
MDARIWNNLMKFKYNSIYFRLFSLFISLIFIPSIFIGTFIYLEASKKFQEEVNKYNMYTLEYVEDQIESVMDNINMLSAQYIMDGEVRYFTSQPFESDRLALERLYKRIGNTCVSYPYIDSMYVYYQPYDKIITNSGVYDYKEFYDQSWASSLAQAKDKYTILPPRKIQQSSTDGKKEKYVISYITYFPLFGAMKTGAIVININVNELVNSLNMIKKDATSMFFVINSEEKILISDKDEYILRNFKDMSGEQYNYAKDGKFFIDQFKNQKMLFSYTASNKMNWKFVELTPIETVKRNVAFIKKTVILVLLLMTLILIAVVYLITNKIYNPLVYLMDIVKGGRFLSSNPQEQNNAKNEMDMLTRYLNDVSVSIQEEKDQNKLLKSQVVQTKNIMEKNLFNHLILSTGEETDSIIERLRVLDWPNNNYILLLISLDDYEAFQQRWDKKDQALWKYCILNISEELINSSHRGIIFEDSLNQWVVIVNLLGIDEANVYNEAKELSEAIRKAVQTYIKAFTVTIGIGSYCMDISLLPESYENAMKAIQYKWLKGKDQTLTYNELNQSKNEVYYNVEAEKNIMNTLFYKNDLRSVEVLFDSFIKELKVKNHYNYDHVYQGMLQILVATIRIFHEKGIDSKDIFSSGNQGEGYNILSDFRKKETLSDVEKWILQRFRRISDYLWEQRNGSGNENITSIQEYLLENYQEEISLSTVAEKFGYSEHGLSKLFKKIIGENFLEYLTRVRVDNAKRLMMESERSINEISQLVGYTNVQTFIRVFKRLENITPGQYKEDIKLLKATKKTQ